MFKQDEEKIAFMIDTSNYYYLIMPFGLKNVGAMYQRLMDKIFTNLLGRNLEVYVDNMKVKRRSSISHLDDLVEILVETRKHNMRLNPEKMHIQSKRQEILGLYADSQGN